MPHSFFKEAMVQPSASHNKDAVSRLTSGYHKFKSQYFQDSRKLYEDLVKNGQSPKIMVIACSDSRVAPSIILNALPGELFVVRNVANLVPPFNEDSKPHGTSAALEFAVLSLQVTDIIVLGHSYCGGIKALLKSPEQSDSTKNSFVTHWMGIATRAREETLKLCQNQPFEQQAKFCEEQTLLLSLKNLLTFPWIHKRVSEGTLSLHAWHFDLSTGMMRQYDPALEKLAPHRASAPEFMLRAKI